MKETKTIKGSKTMWAELALATGSQEARKCGRCKSFKGCEFIEPGSMECNDRRRAANRERSLQTRRARREAMQSLGLVEVKGALGGKYWE